MGRDNPDPVWSVNAEAPLIPKPDPPAKDGKAFVKAVVAYVAIVAVGIAGGILYSIGAFAVDVKAVNQYSQEDVNIVSAALYLGVAAFAIPIGYISSQWPQYTMVTGSIVCVAGWILSYLAVANQWSAAAFAAIMAVSGCAVAALPMPTIITGLGDIIAYNPAWAAWANTLFVTLYGLAGCVAAGVYLTPANSLVDKLEYLMLGFAGICAISLCITVGWLFYRRSPSTDPSTATAVDAPATARTKASTCSFLLPLRPIVCSFDFWLMQGIMILAFGSAVNFYNTAGSMALSLGGSDADSKYLFMAFGAAQTASRLVSAPYLGTPMIPTRLMHVLAVNAVVLLAIGAVAHFENSVPLMYVFSVLNGGVYGSLWVLMFGCRDIHILLDAQEAARSGTTDYIMYGAMNIGPAIGPLVFDKASGVLYDALADASHLCRGLQCFQTYFTMQAVACAVAGVCVGVLWLRIARRPSVAGVAKVGVGEEPRLGDTLPLLERRDALA